MTNPHSAEKKSTTAVRVVEQRSVRKEGSQLSLEAFWGSAGAFWASNSCHAAEDSFRTLTQTQ